MYVIVKIFSWKKRSFGFDDGNTTFFLTKWPAGRKMKDVESH
jgi:hypothetical protein